MKLKSRSIYKLLILKILTMLFAVLLCYVNRCNWECFSYNLLILYKVDVERTKSLPQLKVVDESEG